MLHLTRAPKALPALGFTALALCLPLFASDKKSAPAPAPRPAASSSRPASGTAARPGATGTHPGATTSHGPTTSGVTTHGPTTSGVRTTGGAATTGGMRPAGAPGAAGARPGEAPHLAASGPLSHAGPTGSRDIRVAGGGAVRMRADGHPSDFHDARRGMDIHRNLAGGRRVSVERADHSRLVFERGRRGYIAHPYMFHGREFARRAYYFHGRFYNRFYGAWYYRGYHLEYYAPWRFYSVGFYGWAYHPWGYPVPYAWGWGPAPWYGYYGAYFAPYPAYASPSLWLTDYTIAASLQASYDAAAADGPPPPLGPDAAPAGPEVKQMVADEVQRQLALENQEAQMNAAGQPPDPNSSSVARMLSDGQPHAFIAGSEVDVTDSTGQECAITDGDVLQLTAPPPPDSTSAQLMVMSSKGGKDCRRMAMVTVPIDALQEMQNHMRETVDQGLAELQARQGTGGLPAAPPSATTPPVTAAAAADAPAPDPAGAQELAAQDQQANQSEQQLTAQAAVPAGGMDGAPPPPSPTAPVPQAAPASTNITAGESMADVKAALGQPTRILNLGPKVIYVYSGMKITFKDGKVTDMQ
jgi:hypothetical protein